MTVKPILKYPGGKWSMAEWIVGHLPPHTHYVEPYFGSGAVFFNKRPAKHEVINDLSGDVVNLFRVIRERGAELAALIEMTPWAREEYERSYEPCEDALERARRFVVMCWMGQKRGGLDKSAGWRSTGKTGQRAEGGPKNYPREWRSVGERILNIVDRLRNAEIDHIDAVKTITRHSTPDALIYADPPYPLDTRSHSNYYQHEMTDADHLALLDALDAHPGPVLLSGYACALYDDRLGHWHRVTKQVQAEKGNTRTEVLWLNEAARPRTLFDMQEAERV